MAKEACQEHHREQHPPLTPAKAPDEKPKRELGDWMIGRPPTEETRAMLAVRLAETSEEMQALETELAIAERAFKATRKRIEKEIAEIRERQQRFAAEVRHGMSAKLKCWKERIGDDWAYYDAAEGGEELFREPAATGPQQKLVGDRTVPKDPPPDKPPAKPKAPPLKWEEVDDPDSDDEVVARSGPYRITVSEDGSCIVAKRDDEELYATGNVTARDLPERIAEARDVCAEDAQRRNCNGEPAEPEPEADSQELPAEWDLRRRNEWEPVKEDGKIAYYRAGNRDGDHYRVKKGETGLHGVTFHAGGRVRELDGTHARLKDAFAEAHADNQTRLRWPLLEPGQQIIACGPYQLARASDHPDDDPEQDDWQIAYVAPGLDGKATDLGTHAGLTAAQDACQVHAAELRATEEVVDDRASLSFTEAGQLLEGTP